MQHMVFTVHLGWLAANTITVPNNQPKQMHSKYHMLHIQQLSEDYLSLVNLF
jgi:hypothetical protein